MHDDSTTRRGKFGCWLAGVGTLVLLVVLVIAGLFLPPFDLYNRLRGEPYAILHSKGDSLTSSDKVVRVTAANDEASGFSLRFKTWTQTPDAPDWATAAFARLPRMLVPRSKLYALDTTARPQNALVLSVELPISSVNPDLVDIYGWYGNALNGQWRFVPSETVGSRRETVTRDLPRGLILVQATPVEPQVIVSYETTQILQPQVSQVARIVSPSGLAPLADGQITGGLAAGVAVNSGYQVMPVIRDYLDPRAVDNQTVNAILGNPQLRQQHAAMLAATASVNQYAGIFIDYRGLAPEQRDNYSLFLQETANEMKKVGLLLGVVVPMPENQAGVWNTGAYDWRAIGQAAAFVQINVGIAPQTFLRTPDQPVQAMLTWAKGEISRYKIIVGLSAESVREMAGTVTRIGYDAGLAQLGNVQVDSSTITPGSEIRARLDGAKTRSGIDQALNAPYIEYLNSDDSVASRVWLTTPDALRYRLDSTIALTLGGVGFDDLMSDDLADGLINEIQNYRLGLPAAPAPVDLVLRWRIEGANGLIGEVRTDLNAPLVITLAAPDGDYSINVAVEGQGQKIESARPGVKVAQYSPTATPTPRPTETPTPAPTATPTLSAINATVRPPANQSGGSTGGGQAVRPGGGSIAVGAFEYGGQVTSTGSGRAIPAMQRAGMTWMKIQKRFHTGGADNAAGDIATAHANGFKVLVTGLGSPEELQAGGDSYVREYASWLGSVAAAGADAIEVWNEPNLDREWPEGQISGAAYANMLRMAYQTIKASNGGTMVISAAPAPTGAEAAYPGKVRNDDGWLREMVDAGGLQYMDCLGVHYNEGIMPPNATSGDPRDPYYTRYLPSVMNTYWAIIGGQKPLCFTELGYLSPEGYGELPSFFAWASNVTVSQQAAWLAQAAAITSQSSKVRLMIVWNVDFTIFGSDPQGGYAIVRPDGSCPACDALAGAR